MMKKKEYYVKLRQAHKLFEMSYEEYETLLLNKFHESDEYFYNIRSLLEKIIGYYNVGADYCNGAVVAILFYVQCICRLIL